jgi:hypothetical protein
MRDAPVGLASLPIAAYCGIDVPLDVVALLRVIVIFLVSCSQST